MAVESRKCKRCGRVIPRPRLNALPDTWLCIECSREVGGDWKVIAVPVNTGKPGSMKKNYGSWTIVKSRRRISPKSKND